MRSWAPFRRSLLAAALAVGIHAAMAETAATAQDRFPSIGVVDVQMILRNSKASKSVRPQIEKLRTDYQASVREREAGAQKGQPGAATPTRGSFPASFRKETGSV